MSGDPASYPKWIRRFLRAICPEHLLEEIEGDLIQKFQRDVSVHGGTKAKTRFIWNAIRFLRPGIVMRNRVSLELNEIIMLQSYFIIMVRSLMKRKFNSAINVLCLTTGITFTLLMGTFIWSELRVNEGLKDVDRLYLVQSKYKTGNGGFEWFAPGLLSTQAVGQYPAHFENYYRFWDRNITISKGERHFRIQSMIGDASFIEIFGFEVLYGEVATALHSPNSMVITEKVARKYFDRSDVVGETLSVATERNGAKEYKVTAVLADPDDKNSVSDFMNMDAQVFLSLENKDDFFAQAQPDTWQADLITYVKLRENVSDKEAETIMNEIWKSHAPATLIGQRSFALNSLEDYYLVTNHGAVKKMILSLSIVVMLILFLAIANFINISIASSFSRIRETGVRKVMGGMKGQVIVQFLVESITLSFFSGIIGLLLYELLHDYVGAILNTPLPSVIYMELSLWLMIAGSTFGIGIIAGIYPAIFQALAKPIESLKGKPGSIKSTLHFSRVLVGAQFLITTVVFIGAVILSRQVSYFLEKDLGYDKSHVLIVGSVPRLWNDEGFIKMEAARQQFLRSPKVKEVSLSWGAPGWSMIPFNAKISKADQSQEEGVNTAITSVDEEYIKVYELRLLKGKFLINDNGLLQPNSLVINETAQKEMNVRVSDKVTIERFNGIEFIIGGIVHDFNFESLHEKVKPIAFMHNRDFAAYRCFSFKLEPGSLPEAVAEVEQLWKGIFPNDPFDYDFIDEKVRALYTTELQLKQASSIATVLMLIIVMTGVLGMVSLSVSRREKEIGIRKVLGASISNILLLFSREYSILITIALLLAIPVAYYFGDLWLQHFAYSIELTWWMFALPGGVLFCLTLLVVNTRSLKTALANPVKSLRAE